MKIRKSTMKWIALAAVLLAVLGIVIFRMAVMYKLSVQKVLWMLCAVGLWVLVVLLVRFIWLSVDREQNYFLYNNALQKNCPVDELTFKQINERMSTYFSVYFEPESRLWLGNEWTRRDKFGSHGQYCGVVAYKMLYNLVAADDTAKWEWFGMANIETIRCICDALANAGERDLAQKLFYIKRHGGDAAALRGFLMGNRAYLANRMTQYVKQNIERFYEI